MRALRGIILLLSVALLVGGSWLASNADLMIERPEVRRLGEKLRWPGMYATTTRGCFFRPDEERWQARLRLAGGGVAIVGIIGAAAGTFLWRRSVRLAVMGKVAA